MARLDQDRQKALEPKRMEKAIAEVSKYGYEITHQDDTKIKFEFKGKMVTYYPYSGWASGGSIIDGRGLQHLINQIKNEQKN
jgi:hypothetical protein